MGPREEGVTHTATPLGLTGRGTPRISEEALLAVRRSRTNNLRQMHMRVEEVIPRTGINRIREELSLATRTGGKFQSLKQQL